VIELLQPVLDDRVYSALLESVDETMTALLSRRVVDALYVNLETVHSIPRDEIPYKIETLCSTLQKIFGSSGMSTISRAIARKLFIKLGLTFPDGPPRTLPDYLEEAKVRNREGV
jgi:H2-forming N5,N10-methylenetetrahydromethanopterin dehydrogenase-like enzyme